MNKRPTKKAFYAYMSSKFNSNYKDPSGYITLLEVIQEADKSEERFMDLAELTLMNKTDRLIHRNAMSVMGIELTPLQLDEYLAIVEYGLEYVS